MKLAIYGRPQRGPTLDCALNLVALLEKEGIGWHISDKLGEVLMRTGKFMPRDAIFLPEAGLPEGTDYVVSIGGDGTLLEAVSFAAPAGTPVVGVHTGRLGYLAAFSFSGLEHLVRRLQRRDYRTEHRSLVEVDSPTDLFDGRNFGLNELAIMRRDSSAMITVHARLNGQYLNSYWADGLIISTPTGSTGYSLSCGGPIVHPSSQSFVITPVSPHNLNVRPLVLPDDSVLEFDVEGRSKKILLSLDTRSRSADVNTKFTVRKSSMRAILVRLPEDDFVDTLRNKLYWGADLRN